MYASSRPAGLPAICSITEHVSCERIIFLSMAMFKYLLLRKKIIIEWNFIWVNPLLCWIMCKAQKPQSSRRCRQSGQTRGKPSDPWKTFRPGETRTHDHAFRGYLRYNWATGPYYWTSRLSCYMVELKVSYPLIHCCQLNEIKFPLNILEFFRRKGKRYQPKRLLKIWTKFNLKYSLSESTFLYLMTNFL